MRFETPEAFANFRPGLKRRRRSLISAQGSSLREPWVSKYTMRSNPEKGSPTAEPFQGCTLFFIRVPRVRAPARTLGIDIDKCVQTLKRVRRPRNPFRVAPYFLFVYPGFERQREPWVTTIDKCVQTLKGFADRGTLSGLHLILYSCTQGSRKLEPWAEISQRLRRFKSGLKLANAFGVVSNFRDVMIGGSRCGDQGFGCEFFESLVVS
jgi:hypothetical protein